MLKEKGFYKGINFGGWLSQCEYTKEHMDSFITDNDFKTVSSWGLDHIRVPFDYNIIEDNGKFIEDGFERLEYAIEQSKKNNLNTVLDLHKTAGFFFSDYSDNEHGFFEDEKFRERFYRLWEELAKRFGKYSDTVAFELLNEVTDKEYITVWNETVRKCISRIRKYAPDTLILVGSYENNSAKTVEALDAPYDDKVIYNMHCYEPLKFTHQGAYWTSVIDPEKRLSYVESETSTDYFEKLFASALAKAEKHGTELYCGEYGVIDRVSPADTLAWFRDINAVFEKYGIARSAWSYKKMDFGISDERLDNVRSEILKYL